MTVTHRVINDTLTHRVINDHDRQSD